MKKYTALILLLCAAALCAAWIVTSRYAQRSKEPPQTEIIGISADDIESVEISNRDEVFTLERDADKWKITEDGQTVVPDTAMVDSWLEKVISASGESLGECEAPADYGLEQYRSRLDFRLKGGGSALAVLGDDTPAQTESYVTNSDNELFSVYTSVSSLLQKHMYDFIDDYMTGVEYDKLKEIYIKNKDGETVYTKNGDSWYIGTQQQDTEIVRSQITRYIGGVYSMRRYIKTDERIRAAGLDSPVAVLKITDVNGNITQINIGITDGNTLYVTMNDTPFIYHVEKECFPFLTDGNKMKGE